MNQKIIAIIPLLLLSIMMQAQVVYVDVNASGANNGSSWTDAFTDVKHGVGAASSGEQVWVASGTYYLHPGGPLVAGDTSIWLKTGVDLYGGFAGGEANLSDRDWTTNVTILDGGNNAVGNRKVSHVIIADSVTNCRVDGFTIQNGDTRPNTPALDAAGCSAADMGVGGTSQEAVLACGGRDNGAGILINQSDPVIANCIITNNEAGKGGGVYIMAATATSDGAYPVATFNNCRISNNSASGRGGGVAIDLHSDPVFNNCKFINNSCDDKGGAVYMDWGCDPVFVNCVIVGSYAIRGAAMGIDGSSYPTLTHCTVSNNFAVDIGAGLYTGSYNVSNPTSNDPNITNSIIWGNRTQQGGPVDLAVWHENHFLIENSIIGTGFITTDTSVLQNTDPLFADTASGDYTLQNSSPAVDRGTASPAYSASIPSIDADSNARSGAPDIGAFEAASALPIHLVRFTATPTEDYTALLEYETATEEDVSYYIIEKSADGVHWNTLKQLDKIGGFKNEYVYTDEAPYLPVSYYRIKAIDFDASISYSPVRSVTFSQPFIDLVLYPNPTENIVNVSFTQIQPSTITISVFSIDGKLVMNQQYPEQMPGNVELSIDLEGLNPQNYLLEIQAGRKTIVRQFSKR